MLRVFKPTAGPRWPATRPSTRLFSVEHAIFFQSSSMNAKLNDVLPQHARQVLSGRSRICNRGDRAHVSCGRGPSPTSKTSAGRLAKTKNFARDGVKCARGGGSFHGGPRVVAQDPLEILIDILKKVNFPCKQRLHRCQLCPATQTQSG